LKPGVVGGYRPVAVIALQSITGRFRLEADLQARCSIGPHPTPKLKLATDEIGYSTVEVTNRRREERTSKRSFLLVVGADRKVRRFFL